MKEQWPSERTAECRDVVAGSSFKNKQDFLSMLSRFSNALPDDFDNVVVWIVEQSGSLDELEQRIAPIVAAANLQDDPESPLLLMTLACAVALARAPSLHTWGRVNAFKYNSWQLAHWLAPAMIAYAQVDLSARNAYASLAKVVFAALDTFSLHSQSDRTNEERASTLVHWTERQDKLGEIWWDLRGWRGFMNYEEELPLFQVFYALEPDEFIRTMPRSSNPYLVSALLFVAGIGPFSPRYSEWQRMIAAAPAAFEEGGGWNGSVLMPLLLVEARNQLLQVQHPPRSQDLTSTQLDEKKQEIHYTAKLIVTALTNRQDAPAIFARWTPWLMRQILNQTSAQIADVNSAAFADNALIDAIGRNLGNCTLPQTSPGDAPLWEAWCYRCALASFAYSGHAEAPDWKTFGDEWHLAPEDWVGRKGQLLRERSSLITATKNEIPGVAAHLLAYPITQSSSPAEAWIDLWNSASTLREIVEFGDADAIDDEYSSRLEAGRLLLLLFRIGLAIFDQGAARSVESSSPNARSLAWLFGTLHFATCEMREIDRTLNRDEWLVAVQHLAVRRMIWEYSAIDEVAPTNYQVFKADDTPLVADILLEAKSDVIELVAILQSLLLNDSDVSRLKSVLNTVSIDLAEVVQSIRNLSQYHPRKYPIDDTQLQKLAAY